MPDPRVKRMQLDGSVQCTTVAPAPTAHTSTGLRAKTELRVTGDPGTVAGVQPEPS